MPTADSFQELLRAANVSWEAAALTFRVLGLLSIPSVLVQRRGSPLSAISWILGLASIPGLALPLWWLLGRRHLERKRRKRRLANAAINKQLTGVRERVGPDPEAKDGRLLALRRVPEELRSSVFPATSGDRVELLIDGKMAFPAMEQAIAEAKHHVHFLYYIWKPDEQGTRFRDLLAGAAKSGVEVRALFDSFGSGGLKRRWLAPLAESKAQLAAFLPVSFLSLSPVLNFRNHRKILIVDGRVAFTGGINIGDEYVDTWHDFAVKLEGPVVDQLQEVFAEDWYFASKENLAEESYFGCWDRSDSAPGDSSCAVVASGPDLQNSAMQDVFMAAITQSRQRVWITTPYFVPSPTILAALRVARYHGADVRLLLPGKSDLPFVRRAARAYYLELIQAGIRVYEYQPRILHAKGSVFDDDLSIIGSANMDIRSFRLNFEANCVIQGTELNHALSDLFEHDLSQSEEISLEQLKASSWPTRVIDSAAHLLSPLL